MKASSMVAAYRQKLLTEEMRVLAQNLANASDNSFKKLFLHFYSYEDNKPAHPVHFVHGEEVKIDFSNGRIKTTGNPLDVALRDSGFFVVGSGEDKFYTRNGKFTLDSQGYLSDVNGKRILNYVNEPIKAPEDAKNLRIDKNGGLVADGVVIDQIAVASFDDTNTLKRCGYGLYRAGSEPNILDTIDVNLEPGSLEESNVNLVMEMALMAEVEHHYRMAQEVIDAEHEKKKGFIEKIRST